MKNKYRIKWRLNRKVRNNVRFVRIYFATIPKLTMSSYVFTKKALKGKRREVNTDILAAERIIDKELKQ